ncbi:MAG: hypothetical protein AB7I30_07645, partial [Isosphaeraceae bacterium]
INDVFGAIDEELTNTQSIPLTRVKVMGGVVDLQRRFAEGAEAGVPERLRLARALVRFARALQDMGDYPMSTTILTEALTWLRERTDATPEDHESLATRAHAQTLLGRAWFGRGNDAMARTEFTRAVADHERILTRDPNRHRERAELALIHAELALIHARVGESAAADDALARSRQGCQDVLARIREAEMADDKPAWSHWDEPDVLPRVELVIDLLESVSRALSHRATTCLTLGRVEEARGDAALAVAHARDCWVRNPFNPDARLVLTSAQLGLAQALEATHPDVAERIARGSREMAAWLMEDLPGLLEPLSLERRAIAYLDRTLRARGRDAEAAALHKAEKDDVDRRTGWPSRHWSKDEPAELPFLRTPGHPTRSPN